MATPTPTFELARVRRRRGDVRIYISVYRRPLRFAAFGRWLVGRPW